MAAKKSSPTKIIVTPRLIRRHAKEKQHEIRRRLNEFAHIRANASDEELWHELVFCIFTAGASARMGLRSVEAVKPHLKRGSQSDIETSLVGTHRYPRARAGYIAVTREFLVQDCNMRLRERLESFTDDIERRDWIAKTPAIKGIGYKEASHFLRNVGFRNYAILDKHILKCMFELGALESPNPPTTRARYMETERRLSDLARQLEIDFDELDLVLWSIKTGEILK